MYKETCSVYGGGVQPGRRAGSGVGWYIVESPKQVRKRFSSITKTIHFAHLVILFIYSMHMHNTHTTCCHTNQCCQDRGYENFGTSNLQYLNYLKIVHLVVRFITF